MVGLPPIEIVDGVRNPIDQVAEEKLYSEVKTAATQRNTASDEKKLHQLLTA